MYFAVFTFFSTFALSIEEFCSRGLRSPILLQKKMIGVEAITELITNHLKGSDVFLVDVMVKPGNAIKVFVDTPEGISIDECVNISRFLNESLDRDVEDYSLEVSSPGLGAGLRVKQQYEKHKDREIEVLYTHGIKDRGTLLSVSDKGIVLEVKGEQKEIDFKEIKTAKAVIAFN
jgi:ribosome maturation factor RimP